MSHHAFHPLAAAVLSTLVAMGSAAAETDNEKAANGPIPGDVSLYAVELKCAQELETPGGYLSLNGAELADAQRSGFYPCASFTGSFSGTNKVYAWRAQDTYQGANFLNNGLIVLQVNGSS